MAEYVLVIHGTWNEPKEGEKKDQLWYQWDPKNPQNFCRRLNEALAHTMRVQMT